MQCNNLLKSLIRSVLKIFFEKIAIKFQHSSQQSIVVALFRTLSLVCLWEAFGDGLSFSAALGFVSVMA
jgi:hypothetical protein